MDSPRSELISNNSLRHHLGQKKSIKIIEVDKAGSKRGEWIHTGADEIFKVWTTNLTLGYQAIY